MSGMFWIALELSIPKIGFIIMLSLKVKKVDVFQFDGVAESDNTVLGGLGIVAMTAFFLLTTTKCFKAENSTAGPLWIL